jgi:hypothetical protein
MPRGKNIKNFIMNDFYCTQCGEKGVNVWRKLGAEREAGHLKRLFCLRCQKETNHAECREGTKYAYIDFLVEFEYHNFDKDGNRKMTYGELKEAIKNGKI